MIAAKPTRYIIVCLILLFPVFLNAETNTSLTTDDNQQLGENSDNRIEVNDPGISDPHAEPIVIAAALGSDFMKQAAKDDPSKLSVIPDDDDSLRLLELRIGKYKFDELIATYQVGDTLFVPLGFLSELIDLAITTDPATGIAQGFIFQENRPFYLDAKRGEVTTAGQLSRFKKKRVAIRELDDIYVDSYLLGDWLPLKLDINLYASRLSIISDKPLPFELRKMREERIAKIQTRAADRVKSYPTQKEPYQKWTYPMVNQSARAGFIRDSNGDFKSTFGYSTFASADLFYMESAWYLSGTEDDLFEDARVTFARRDPSESLAGRLQATEYAVGYIDEPRLDAITRPLDPQPGALISNFPLARQLQYDS